MSIASKYISRLILLKLDKDQSVSPQILNVFAIQTPTLASLSAPRPFHVTKPAQSAS